jgi:hypothetical protein
MPGDDGERAGGQRISRDTTGDGDGDGDGDGRDNVIAGPPGPVKSVARHTTEPREEFA